MSASVDAKLRDDEAVLVTESCLDVLIYVHCLQSYGEGKMPTMLTRRASRVALQQRYHFQLCLSFLMKTTYSELDRKGKLQGKTSLTLLCDIALAPGRQAHHHHAHLNILHLDAVTVSSADHCEQVLVRKNRYAEKEKAYGRSR